ncbi:uncharacterized protein [Penaeus vannamei]|uniref:uncharacterized protein n=1 Tax=Penaeus vannamei TaxID=6689 RepID=UPI00387F8558
MFITALAFLFLLRLRFPNGKSTAEIITRRYGQPTLKTYRCVNKNIFKTKKLELDLVFLNHCKLYNIIPNFLRFKSYDKSFLLTNTYKSWLLIMLEREIKRQSRKLTKLKVTTNNLVLDLKSKDSVFDFKCLSALINHNVDRRLSSVKEIHHRKLRNLGIDLRNMVDINKVIFNFSDRTLPVDEKNALSLGLDFGLRPRKLSYVKFFTHFERICHMLKHCNIYKDTFNAVFNKISALANNMYVQHCRESMYSPDHTEQYANVLQNLKDDDSIVITRPDKGKGIVILNKTDYCNKISNILADSSKFKLLNVDLSSHLLKLEDKLNRLLRPIKETINEATYNSILASGSRPGCLYGLPKVHKTGTPLRPIVSSINTFNYNLAKFLNRPLYIKKSVVSSVFQRAYRVCDKEFIDRDLDIIFETLEKNRIS